MATKHQHRSKERTTTGWTHCVMGPEYCDGGAHGTVTHRDECRCGAVKWTESNLRHTATTGWLDPEEE